MGQIEAGITLARLQGVLKESGQRLPLDAPQPDRATLGGIFATNTSGPRRFGEGRPRVPSLYALEVWRAMTGRVPTAGELQQAAARASQATLSWPAPADRTEAIDALEHDLATLRGLVAEPDHRARRHSSADAWHTDQQLPERFLLWRKKATTTASHLGH